MIGGGWAGFAAALELTRAGAHVTLLEASRQLGGRARRVPFEDHIVDNGQHVLLGAYADVLSQLAQLGVPEARVFRRAPLRLTLYEYGSDGLSLHIPSLLPAPWHAAYAIGAARGLSPLEKRAALRLMRALARGRVALDTDIAVATFLKDHRQSTNLVQRLWQPLCLATLNTPIEQASMQLFVKVLRDAFMQTRKASHLLLPVTDLSRCFPEPARDYIEQHGGSVRLATRAQALQILRDRVQGVSIERSTLLAQHVVIATAPKACLELIRPHWLLASVAQTVESLGTAPICTVYLRYPDHIRLQHPFVGLVGTHTQWLFDRGQLTGEAGLLAAVISGPGPHMRWEAGRLSDTVIAEIAQQFPDWPPPLGAKLIRERQATFAAHVGCEALRPTHATPVAGLWLAGDYVATGLPSTLEGAVRSGVECARQIIQHERAHARLSSTG